MSFVIRAGENTDDVRAAIAPIWHYFGHAPTDEAVLDFAQLMTPERILAACDGDSAVGGCGSFPFRLTTPGGHVRAAGLSMVGVQPTHRRKGILSSLIKRVLADCRTRDEPVAYLWASEERIYGRFGFGLTALSADIEVSRDHTQFLTVPTSGSRARKVALDAAIDPLSRIYDRVVEITPGAFARSLDWWRLKVLTDPAWQRRGSGEKQCVVIDIDGEPAAYALYRIVMNIERGVPTGGVDVLETAAISPPATAAIWRFLLDMDWTSWIKGSYLPLDHPLVLLAAEPRRLKFRQRDGAWLRLVDVAKALSARAYGPGEVVIEIDDALCPDNAGRWVVRAGDVKRTERSPDLRCNIDALACAYLGGFSWRQLVTSSRAFAQTDDAVTRADRVFETRGAPWCPEIF